MALMVALAACGDTGGGGEGAGSGVGDRGGASTGSGTVRVFAAASLSDAFDEMADAFGAAHRGVDVTFSFAGSSALVQQVADGAPADAVATADQRTMRRLVEEADGSPRGDPQVFARNHLALVVPTGNPGEVSGLADLADGDLFVGLCAVEVPCGHLSAEVLAGEGVTAEVDSYEPDVRSLLTKLAAGELDAGLVYQTDAAAAGEDVEVVAVPELQDWITGYPIVALDTGADPAGGTAFVAFVLSEEGQDILRRHGFTAP